MNFQTSYGTGATGREHRSDRSPRAHKSVITANKRAETVLNYECDPYQQDHSSSAFPPPVSLQRTCLNFRSEHLELLMLVSAQRRFSTITYSYQCVEFS